MSLEQTCKNSATLYMSSFQPSEPVPQGVSEWTKETAWAYSDSKTETTKLIDDAVKSLNSDHIETMLFLDGVAYPTSPAYWFDFSEYRSVTARVTHNGSKFDGQHTLDCGYNWQQDEDGEFYYETHDGDTYHYDEEEDDCEGEEPTAHLPAKFSGIIENGVYTITRVDIEHSPGRSLSNVKYQYQFV